MPRIRDVLTFDDRTIRDLANVAMFVGIFLVLLGAFTSFLGYAHGLEWHFKEIGPAISGLGVMSIIMATVTYIRLYLKKKARRRPRQERYYNGDVYGHLTTDDDPGERIAAQLGPSAKDEVTVTTTIQEKTTLEIPASNEIPMTSEEITPQTKAIKAKEQVQEVKKSWVKKTVTVDDGAGNVRLTKPLQNHHSVSDDRCSMSSTTALYNENFVVK